MPGTVRGAIAIGTLPFSLSTKFTEVHSLQVNVNEYHDGASQRTALVASPRKTWKLSKRLTPHDLGLLRNFYEAARGAAFYFYNPSESLYSTDPAGTLGQYLVRFNNDWDQTNDISRIVTSIELMQVASDQDIGEA